MVDGGVVGEVIEKAKPSQERAGGAAGRTVCCQPPENVIGVFAEVLRGAGARVRARESWVFRPGEYVRAHGRLRRDFEGVSKKWKTKGVVRANDSLNGFRGT